MSDTENHRIIGKQTAPMKNKNFKITRGFEAFYMSTLQKSPGKEDGNLLKPCRNITHGIKRLKMENKLLREYLSLIENQRKIGNV